MVKGAKLRAAHARYVAARDISPRFAALRGNPNVATARGLAMPQIVTRDVPLVDRAKSDCLEGGTHEETLRPQVNPKVQGQRSKEAEVLSRLLKDPRIR